MYSLDPHKQAMSIESVRSPPKGIPQVADGYHK